MVGRAGVSAAANSGASASSFCDSGAPNFGSSMSRVAMRMPSGTPLELRSDTAMSRPRTGPVASPFTRLVPNTPAFAWVCSFSVSSPVEQMSSKNWAATALRVK